MYMILYLRVRKQRYLAYKVKVRAKVMVLLRVMGRTRLIGNQIILLQYLRRFSRSLFGM